MKIAGPQKSNSNVIDFHFSHVIPIESYRKGPLLWDEQSKENMIQIQNENQSIKSPTINKSEVCIFSPALNSAQFQGNSLIQKINSLHQESYFNSLDHQKHLEEQFKLKQEFEEIPQQINNFVHFIENQNYQKYEQSEDHRINLLDILYRYLIVMIYLQQILTLIYLPYATANNSMVIYNVLLLLKFIDLFVQIILYVLNQKGNWRQLKRQSLSYTQYEIMQIVGVFCLIFLTHTQVSKWLITIFVLLCSFPKIKFQELSLKLEFSLKQEQFSIYFLIFRLCIYIHLLTCFWYDMNQGFGENQLHHDYWDSLFAVVSIISFNNQTTITENHEKLCFSLVSMSGLFVFAYIFQQTKEHFSPSKLDLSQVQQAFSRVPLSLKLQIIKHCNEQVSKCNIKNQLFLPIQIANKLTFNQGYRMFQRFFSEYEETTLTKCLDLCEQIEAQTEEILLKEGQVDDCSIYFILQGKVKVVDRYSQKVFAKKEAGECFGEYAFYTQRPRSANIVSDGCCRLLKLRRVDFLGCLSWKDKQIFQLEQEQMLYSDNYKWQCYCCNSHRHTINRCPKLTYRPKKEKVLTQYIKESINTRLNIRRGRIAKHQSAWVIKKQLSAYENNRMYMHNDFYTPTSCLTSNFQLPYDENQIESIINQSSYEPDIQTLNVQLENGVEINNIFPQNKIATGFRPQIPQRLLTDSKRELYNETKSLELIDQQEKQQIEQQIPQFQNNSSPDFVEQFFSQYIAREWVQQRSNSSKQVHKAKINSLRNSLKQQSTGMKYKSKSKFTPFLVLQNFNEENVDRVQNFQFYRPQCNLKSILQILNFSQK